MAEKSEKSMPNPAAAFKKASDEQLNRLEQIFAESTRFQEQWLTQSQQAIDEMSKVMKSSIQYATDLSAELRRVSLETTKQAFATFAR